MPPNAKANAMRRQPGSHPADIGSVLLNYARSLIEMIVPAVLPQRQPYRSVQQGPLPPVSGSAPGGGDPAVWTVTGR